MPGWLTDVATPAATGAIAASFVVWLLQNWISERLKGAIKHEYDLKLETAKAQIRAGIDKDLEVYKSKLSADSALSVEQLKSSLQIAATERQIRFVRLHEERARVIAEVYQRILALLDASEQYVHIFESSNGPSKMERRQIVAARLNELAEYFEPRKLYLPKDIADGVQQLVSKLVSLLTDFRHKVETKGEEADLKAWSSIFSALGSDVRPMLARLEESFRNMLD